MEKLLIKVCGLREPTNIQAITDLGVDMLGFIFYPPSPRYIAGATSPLELMALNLQQKKVGVFVNESSATMLKQATAYGLDSLQLHGQETPTQCQDLRSRFTVIKAFPVASSADFEQAKAYEGCCDFFLFDTKGPKHGGNGIAFDWDILGSYSGDTPFLLSGGIAPDDAMKITQLRHPKLAGLDLNSRFETSPGLKDVAAINQFINLLI